jgi:hypothetical protein
MPGSVYRAIVALHAWKARTKEHGLHASDTSELADILLMLLENANTPILDSGEQESKSS